MEYISSAINYSDEVARHTDLGEAKYVRQLPLNTISEASTIMFAIPPTDDFIDLQESYMVVKLKVVKKHGTALATSDKVTLSDNVIGSLFKAVSVNLNGAKVTQWNVYQAIENYLVTCFGIAKDATKIHMQALQGLTGEAASKHDSKNEESTGWTIRKG